MSKKNSTLNNIIAVALETFNELKFVNIGIFTLKSANLSKDFDIPACSAPIISAKFMFE